MEIYGRVRPAVQKKLSAPALSPTTRWMGLTGMKSIQFLKIRRTNYLSALSEAAGARSTVLAEPHFLRLKRVCRVTWIMLVRVGSKRSGRTTGGGGGFRPDMDCFVPQKTLFLKPPPGSH